MPEGPASVVLAMLTYLRTDELPDSIEALLGATSDTDARTSVLVVDNDPEGGAMHLAGRWPSPSVRFVHEPIPGIAAARNRALDEAAGNDVLVFIDDDERPADGWLSSLLSTWERSGAAAVVGPVVSTYESELDRWISAGQFFDRRRMPTMSPVSIAATNNLLLDLIQLDRLGVRFDPAFGTTGGSDTLFTRQIHQRGGQMVWCDEAVVYDLVPPSRLTRRWVLLRALRMGNSSSQVALALEDGFAGRTRQRLVFTVRGAVRIVGGAGRMLLGVVTRSVRHHARGARTLARGLGMAGGAWGLVYAEYRRS